MSSASKEDPWYSYADVLEWDEDVRAEIIGGELYMMSQPNTAHQEVSREIFARLYEFLKGKPCQVFYAPFGVRLFPKSDFSDDTYVEPDIVVVCDRSKIDKRGCNGAPNLVVEVLSPSSLRHDRVTKSRLYRRAGVREYWIADPEGRVVEISRLQDGTYVTEAYDETEEAPVAALPGCVIPLGEIFPKLEAAG
jgi:Uma2 family endonuclease